jgi:HK97 family phage major capsid protein
MKLNLEALHSYLDEMGELSNKATHNPQEKRRFAFLQTAVAAIRSGVEVEEVDEFYRRDAARRGGVVLPAKSVRPLFSRDEQAQARGWQAFAGVETRDITEGDPIARIGTYTSLGFFVPTDFYRDVFAAMKQHDALYDEDAVTMIRSTNGRPLPVPVAGDTEVVASVVSENGSQTSVDISSTGHVVLGGYSYSTPRFVASLESFEDLESTLTVLNLYKRFSADRIARGVGADLINGDGTDEPIGLIAALIGVGVVPVTAFGSSANTGGAETGANSIGTADLAAMFQNLDDAYANSSKVAWLMNKKTLGYFESLVSKQGTPLHLVKYDDGYPCIYGIRVRICPSMDNIGASKRPVILGDLSYWATRLIVDGETSGIRIYREAPGLVEQGNVGLRTFVRADGALLWTDTGSPAPFVLLQNHS